MAYQQLIDEIYRVLKPRGTAILVEGHLPASLAKRGLKPRHLTNRLLKHPPNREDVLDWLGKAFGKYDAKFYEEFPAFIDRTALYDYVHLTRNSKSSSETLYPTDGVENNTYGAIGIQATKPVALPECETALAKDPIALGPVSNSST